MQGRLLRHFPSLVGWLPALGNLLCTFLGPLWCFCPEGKDTGTLRPLCIAVTLVPSRVPWVGNLAMQGG